MSLLSRVASYVLPTVSFHRRRWGFGGSHDRRILLVGFDSVGKSSILRLLDLGDIVPSVPWIGTSIETVSCGRTDIISICLGGQDRMIRRVFFTLHTSGVIFVIDSNDRERMQEAREGITKIMEEEAMATVPLLIYANKQDLPNALTPEELVNELGLSSLSSSHLWHLQPCSAFEGEQSTLWKGLQWMKEAMDSPPSQKERHEAILKYNKPT
eukprot:TRINITY_DN1554_c0_g1_i2.p1 TRINITY_DN1554_c0_g1~~TRINITY_DN1554_c0_g1_i2.p1  ORF type:complete len:243 (+),score=25.35 TRINITY_DN1554_c0_g1_i2:96-731(+)